MKMVGKEIRLAATDVSNHLACHHLTYLELSVARGERPKPEWAAPDLVVIQELGLRHEAKYLTHLKASGLEVLNLTDAESEQHILEATRRAMEQGEDVIAQGGAGLRLLGAPGITPLEGGVPIVADGKIIGAIGVSGAASDQDAQCAMAGAAAAIGK